MQLILLVMFLALIMFRIRMPLFETVFSVILLAPILFFLFAGAAPFFPVVYWLVFAALCCVAVVFAFVRKGVPAWDAGQELVPIVFFAVVFIALFLLCQLWPDFISIGERLRDYALLASVIESPISLKEPWLAGYPLNYYAYWYRVGHMFATLFHWQTWEVYHYLQSFCYALFVTAQLRIFRSYLKFSWFSALFCALLISFGSNWAGVLHVLSGAENWWGPSRVIRGVINEFPIWSFLLGDLHPHYLNLPLIPFFLSVLLCLLKQRVRLNTFCVLIAALVLPALWLYNSNAWDMPIWLAYIVTFGGLLLLIGGRERFRQWLRGLLETGSVGLFGCLVLLSLLMLICLALYLSSRNLQPADYPATIVTSKIGRTLLIEMGKHWALPLSLIGLALISLAPIRVVKITAFILVSLLFITQEAWPYLLLLFVLNLTRLWSQFVGHDKDTLKASTSVVAFEAVGIVSLALLIGPEFLFLDDPYGGENERMNTIFKVYSANWFLLHAFAFYLVSQAWQGIANFRRHRQLVWRVQVLVVVLFVMFFIRTIPQRRNSEFVFEPAIRGLSSLDRDFPGSATAVVQLSDLPKGVVLEAQGAAYSYTSHLATLSGKSAYLGWRNHIDLLLRTEGESERRERMTDEIYSGEDCQRKNEILKREGISYVVLGPLERKRYKNLDPKRFSCLEQVINSGQYLVYKFMQ